MSATPKEKVRWAGLSVALCAAALLGGCSQRLPPDAGSPDAETTPSAASSPTSPPSALPAVAGGSTAPSSQTPPSQTPPSQTPPSQAASTQSAMPASAPSATLASTASNGPIVFRSMLGETAITFRHSDGSSGNRYIVETVTAGLALFDYNNDGLPDIYFVSGTPLPGADPKTPAGNRLYRNDGRWHFTDVTERAGVGRAGYGMGATAADYDNDGHQDLYVSNFGPNALFHNNGDGTFRDVTAQAGVGRGHKLGAGVNFLDVDQDGLLDLFVSNYVRFTFENHRIRHTDGYPQYAGPNEFDPEPSSLFRNLGDGRFADVSRESGIGAVPGKGMGTVCADYNNDGATDIFVLNDVFGNFLFQGDGRGKFLEVGLDAGFAFDGNGHELGSMGVDCGDYNNDGWLDFFQTSYQGELPVLFRNLRGRFDDVTRLTGAGAGSLQQVKWGCGFIDFDADGHRDLFLACGHLQDNVDRYSDVTSYKAHSIVLRNTGDGKFVDVTGSAGDLATLRYSSRGAVFGDLDHDGDVDVVVLNSRDEPMILRNMLYENGSKNHWLALRLEGLKCNRDGVGSRVRVLAGDLTLIDEVHSGRGYQSHWGTELHFGLGLRDGVDRIEIYWLAGGVTVLRNQPVDRTITVQEGMPEDAGPSRR